MNPHREHWSLDPEVTFLNHGSFGACPKVVLERQSELRAELEREPVRFLAREILARLDEARVTLSAYLGASADGLAFVTNATTGVNTVLRSLRFEPTDEILVTDHGYPACNNAARFVAELTGARVAIAEIPFPLRSPDEVVAAIVDAVRPSATKLAIIDHITSPTGLVFPIERIVRELESRGVDTLVDGAHAPGMLDLELDALGAPYYTGNCHKWLCAPKGAAFLWVREDRRERVRPLVISHGAGAPRGDRSFFHTEADWTGTCDPTAWLSIPAAIEFGREVVDGGWRAWRMNNRELALSAREVLMRALGIESEPAPAPPEMIGALATLPLPAAEGAPEPPLFLDPLHSKLFAKHGIEVPVFAWPRTPHRMLRISAQLYNSLDQYEQLGEALRTEL